MLEAGGSYVRSGSLQSQVGKDPPPPSLLGSARPRASLVADKHGAEVKSRGPGSKAGLRLRERLPPQEAPSCKRGEEEGLRAPLQDGSELGPEPSTTPVRTMALGLPHRGPSLQPPLESGLWLCVQAAGRGVRGIKENASKDGESKRAGKRLNIFKCSCALAHQLR